MRRDGSNEDTRVYWIDFAKFIAISAVIVDHSFPFLYHNTAIHYYSFFSVGLFIIMTGITTYWSYKKHGVEKKQMVARHCWGVICPYLLATLVYYVFQSRQFVFADYVDHLVHFDAAGPFYYVLLYIQLILLSPILFYYLDSLTGIKYNWLLDLFGIVALVILSFFTTNYSNILDVYGGGWNLIWRHVHCAFLYRDALCKVF